jgi:hypothetical protein
LDMTMAVQPEFKNMLRFEWMPVKPPLCPAVPAAATNGWTRSPQGVRKPVGEFGKERRVALEHRHAVAGP